MRRWRNRAIDAGAPICPVAIRWIPGDPAMDVGEDIAYWREEHTFGPHAWRLLGFKGIRAEIVYGETISSEGHTRKTLAAAAHDAVAALMGTAREPGTECPL